MPHLLGASLLCQQAQLTYKPNMSSGKKPRELAQEESLGPRPQLTSDQISFIRIHYPIRVVRLSRTPIISTRILPRAKQGSETKTHWSLLLMCCLQPDGTISAIHGSNYAAISSQRSERYNAHILMLAVMNSSGYLCMAISTIKHRDLGNYKEYITCISCSYVDLKYPHPQWQLRRV